MSVTAAVAQALSGRRLLLIMDNCEHLLDAAAEFIEAVLGRASAVKVIATSLEGLRVGAEHAWVVPSLSVGDGADSAAVVLFVERAQAANSGFALRNDTDKAAVIEICERLDGIALAIELAAARMVSMTAQDVRDRLGDRFRLLSGARRGLERHQTLRHALGWSYDLLDGDERALLKCCVVFAGGFDLAAAAHLSDDLDEYEVLDVLDSLVRKSLVTVSQESGHARYGILETIRQYAEEQLAATGTIGQVRDRHAAYYADQAVAHWEIWDGPHQRAALDWLDAELANLRAGFRWATDRSDLSTAAAIAANATLLGWALQRFEPVVWAEETLPSAVDAKLAQLPRLYVAASLCILTGQPEVGVSYAQRRSHWRTTAGMTLSATGWAAIGRQSQISTRARWSVRWRSSGAYQPAADPPTSMGAAGSCRCWRWSDEASRPPRSQTTPSPRPTPTPTPSLSPGRSTHTPSRMPEATRPEPGTASPKASPTPATTDFRFGRHLRSEKPLASRQSTATSTRHSACTTARSSPSTNPATSPIWPSLCSV